MRQQNTRFWRIIILDAEVLEWLKAQPLGWQHELNNLARFYMEPRNAPLALVCLDGPTKTRGERCPSMPLP